MNKVAKFEKVSFEQFKKDYIKTLQVSEDKVDERYLRYIYDNIELPKRATTGSAGYDFFSPITFNLRKGESFTIPTGIKAKMEDGWVLTMHIRSSLGFKYGISLSNTTGIVDKDYYGNVNNEGHIFIKLSNVDAALGKDVLIINKDAYCQGVFLPHGITEDDDVTDVRTGGIGSTNK